MILKFKVKNHLSMKNEVVLDFIATKKDKHFDFFCEQIGEYKVLKMAMLLGPNASGKSNILNALDRFRDIVLDDKLSKNDTIEQIPFEFDATTKSSPTFFGIEFLIYKTKFSYNIEFNNKFIIKENLYIYSPNKAKYYSRTTDIRTAKLNLSCGTKFKIEDTDKKTLIGNTLPNMTILSGYNKTSLQNEILQKIRDWFKNQLKPIIEPRSQLTEYVKSKLYKGKINTKQLINLLEVADFNISMPIINKEEIDKELIEEVKEKFPGVYKSMVKNKTEEAFFRLNLFFEHIIKKKDNKEKTYKLDGDLESLGTLRYFGLSGVLTEIIDRTGVLFIDELDSSLHPDLLNQFINTFMLNTKHSQLIFTTHYYPLLEETDELRKDVVWFTEKKEDGSTDLFSLKDINIRAALNYYKAYKTGKFGAKPFIGSAYLSRNEIDNE